MRYFLYTYSVFPKDNFEISHRYGVFGATRGNKTKDLKRDDIIIIRDGSSLVRDSLVLLGCCRVVGGVFDQKFDTPYRDYLWKDELRDQIISYPLRVPVDFKSVLKIRHKILWKEIVDLKLKGYYGQDLKGKNQWGKKFSGNFIDKEPEVNAFGKLLGAEKAEAFSTI